MTGTTSPTAGVPPQNVCPAWEFDATAIRHKVDVALEDFLHQKTQNSYDEHLCHLIDVLRAFVSHGGKRLRPLLCVCGWYAAGGGSDDAVVVNAAASLELFHAFALIHDDVMDRSDDRRGRPSVHRALASFDHSDVGDHADWFGVSVAILLGDLALVWSDEMLAASAGGRGMDLRPVLDAMRTEVMFGQYLDLLSARVGLDDMEMALRVLHYKTAKYTVERPLHIGATLAGADARVLRACTAFALPIGEAFQLRDDLLGVFGDSSKTGKSTIDDLREGKRTPLIAIATRRADRAQARVLRDLFGKPDLDADGAAAIRAVLEATKAREAVEQMITKRRTQGLSALARSGFPDKVSAALQDIAFAATERAS